jgi:transcriptional regulator with XRE-family HTH domain
LDNESIMMDEMETGTQDVNQRIAARVRTLRSELGLSLDGLAARSGVSRSALSLIERAESSPTAVVLDRLAAGLGVPLTSLFGAGDAATAQPLARRADQPVWSDPGSGYLRRTISPEGFASPIEIVEVTFPAGARVAYENGARDHVVHQQVWVLDGTLELTLGLDTHRLEAGDCLALRLDEPTAFRNPTRKPARYAVVVVAEPLTRR